MESYPRTRRSGASIQPRLEARWAGPRLSLHRPGRHRQAALRRRAGQGHLVREASRRPTGSVRQVSGVHPGGLRHAPGLLHSWPAGGQERDSSRSAARAVPWFHAEVGTRRGKIAVLDDADDLNEESANCFLKTLEEPPPRFDVHPGRLEARTGSSPRSCRVARCCALRRYRPMSSRISSRRREFRTSSAPPLCVWRRQKPGAGARPGRCRPLGISQSVARRLESAATGHACIGEEVSRVRRGSGQSTAPSQRRRAALVLAYWSRFSRTHWPCTWAPRRNSTKPRTFAS